MFYVLRFMLHVPCISILVQERQLRRSDLQTRPSIFTLGQTRNAFGPALPADDAFGVVSGENISTRSLLGTINEIDHPHIRRSRQRQSLGHAGREVEAIVRRVMHPPLARQRREPAMVDSIGS